MNQAAFKDPNQALISYSEYLEGLQENQNWSPSMVEALIDQAETIYNDEVNWYTGAQTEAENIWRRIAADAPSLIAQFGNPSTLPKYKSFLATIGAAQSTSQAETQAAGVTGIINVAQDQLEEFAAEQKKRNERYEKLAPFILPVFGLGALYVTLKVLKPY
jgi:hypothetical protein